MDMMHWRVRQLNCHEALENRGDRSQMSGNEAIKLTEKPKTTLSRRTVLGTALAASSARALPKIALKLRQKRVLSLVYDKALGGLRAVDRLVK